MGAHTSVMSRQIGAVDVLYQPSGGACSRPRAALAELDAAGIAVALVSQCKQWSCERQWMCVDTRLEDVARFMRESVRFAGLAGYNPFDATESLREMEAARALGFRGSYVHAASFGVRLGDARLYPLFAKSAELAQPAVLQLPLGEPDVARCTARICQDFPELSLALVHPRPTAEMLALGERFERLAYVVDTETLAWMCRHEREVLDDARQVERCLWGSNGAPLSETTHAALGLELPPATLESILRSNALRYFAATPPSQKPQALSEEVVAAER